MNVKKIESTREQSGGLYPLDVVLQSLALEPCPAAELASGRRLCALLADQVQQGTRW